MRPFVHLNFAIDVTTELSVASAGAEVSCAADWRRVHQLREDYDAIAVGARTWNLDRPRLTARPERLGREPARQPVRVIFSGSQVCMPAQPGTPVFAVGQAVLDNADTVLTAPTHGLDHPLAVLAGHGIRSMLVEGGATLLRSFLQQGLFDCLTLYIRADDAGSAERAARASLSPLPAFRTVRPFGEGFLVEAGMPPGTVMQ